MYSLALAILTLFVSLMVPGALFNISATRDLIKATCLAPATSIAMLSLLALVFSRIGHQTDYKSLMICAGIISLLAFGISSIYRYKTNQQHIAIDKKELFCLALFFTAAAVIAAYVFLSALDGPDCYFQAWDNQTHLRRIRLFVVTGNYSPFNNQIYSDAAAAPILSSGGSSFYPSTWHLLGAMLVSLLNIPVAEAANAVNAFCVGILLPLSLFLCLREIGINKPSVLALCAVICVGVPIYPWDLISYGPLYPNLLGFTLLPGEVALLFHLMTKAENKRTSEMTGEFIILLLGIVSLALVHPNCVFALGLILATNIISNTGHQISSKFQNLSKATCFAIPLLVIMLIWITLNRAPFMSNVVNCQWHSIASIPHAFLDSLFLGTTTHPIQIVISILVFIGLYADLKTGKYSFVITYALLIVFYTIDAGTDSIIKPFFTGFWYNDYHRISAMLGLVSILFACKAVNYLQAYWEKNSCMQKQCKQIAATIVAIIALFLIIFYPSIPIPRKQVLNTAFGYQISEMRNQFDKNMIYYDILSPLEENFCKTKLPQFNSNNSTVINNPDDGSLFLYSVYGLNMYYRTWNPPTQDDETKESNLIRCHLNELSSNDDVKKAVKKTGAKYVLQLDHGDQTQEYRIQYNHDNDSEWRGIDLIDETTPGFTLVASNDDIRLYRIDID